MAPYIEAGSLSDLTRLAANPPKYPRNPTEEKRQPLTLYIARVPGSRDIILTTLKPQLKNVTAGDVASSLYYFHLDSEDDAQLLAEDPDMIMEEEELHEECHKSLPRKPLPESSRASLDVNRQLPPMPQPLEVTGPLRGVGRKALPTETPTLAESKNLQTQGQLPRKPLGPRPLLTETVSDRGCLPGLENRPPSHASYMESSTFPADAHMGILGNKYPSVSTKTFSITIIRRDPSSGAQWNVGKVLGEGQEPSQRPSPSSRKPYFEISVHLTTPGYTQFRDSKANSKTASSGDVTNPLSHLYSAPEPGFNRQIRMEGSNFWDRPKQHIRSYSDVGGRRESNTSPDNNPSKYSNDYGDSAESGTKGYAFGSPWGGKCKFSTSSSGRTLRCKHTIPGPVSAAESGSSSNSSAPVSELRFNLPSLAKFHGSTNSAKSPKSPTHESGRFQMPKFGHIRNKLSPEKLLHPPPALPPRPHPTSYASMYPSDDEDIRPSLPPRPKSSYAAESSDEEEDRLDLSIGQEKAGGGNRGKRAKLGKLIILDEGFKMLDLIVAANMGIWWSVWESNS